MTVDPPPFADPELDQAMTMHERLQALSEPAPSLEGGPELPDMVKDQFVTVDIFKVRPDPEYNPREDMREIESLAANIKRVGLKQVILVRKKGRSWHLADGRRRLAALQLLVRRAQAREDGYEGCERWQYVPAQVEDPDKWTDLDAIETALVTSWHKIALDPIEQAKGIRAWMQGRKIATYEEAASLLGGVSSHTLRGRCQLLDHLTTAEQQEVRGGTMTLSQAQRLVAERREGVAAEHVKLNVPRRSTPAAKRGGSPIDEWFGPQHVLANQARAFCRRGGHKPRAGRGPHGIACLQCWEAVIRRDQTLQDTEARGSRPAQQGKGGGTTLREKMLAAQQATVDEAAAALGGGSPASSQGKRVEHRLNEAIKALGG